MIPSRVSALPPQVSRFQCVTSSNVMIVSWSEQADLPAVRDLSEVSDQLLAMYPSVSAVHLAASDIGLPPSEVRNALLDMMARYGPHTACLAIVLEGSGFWASAMRSVITGMRMLAPRAFAMRIHEDIDEVCEWLPLEHRKRTGVTLDRDALRLALQQARSA